MPKALALVRSNLEFVDAVLPMCSQNDVLNNTPSEFFKSKYIAFDIRCAIENISRKHWKNITIIITAYARTMVNSKDFEIICII